MRERRNMSLDRERNTRSPAPNIYALARSQNDLDIRHLESHCELFLLDNFSWSCGDCFAWLLNAIPRGPAYHALSVEHLLHRYMVGKDPFVAHIQPNVVNSIANFTEWKYEMFTCENDHCCCMQMPLNRPALCQGACVQRGCHASCMDITDCRRYCCACMSAISPWIRRKMSVR